MAVRGRATNALNVIEHAASGGLRIMRAVSALPSPSPANSK